jgi:glucose-6-phosphate dehydrogenase assembly protein OpcA
VLVLKTAREAKAAPIEAWVEANWHSTGGGARHIGSDEVTLSASGEAVDDLAQVVRALLVADVPTAAFWYESSPGDGPLDRELLAAADRLVIGGSSERGLVRLAHLAERRTTGAEMIGLSWLRAAPWRQMLASLFDPPTPIDELSRVARAEITCAPARIGAAFAFVGWLASRLDWRDARLVEPHHFEWKRPDGGTVAARIALESTAPDPFQRVALQTPAGEFELVRAGAAVVSNTPSIAYKQPIHFPEERELWIAALSAQGRDPLFAESIRRIAPLTFP